VSRWKIITGCSFLVVALLSGAACGGDSPFPTFSSESAALLGFTTYSDPQGTFSLAYPQEWRLGQTELFQEAIPEFLQGDFEKALPSLREIGFTVLFSAGSRRGQLLDPSVNIAVVGANPLNISSADQSADQQIDAIGGSDKFQLISRTTGLVGNKDGVLIDIEAEQAGVKVRNVTLHVLDREVVWQVICGSSDPAEFIQVGEICPRIVKSFRLLQ